MMAAISTPLWNDGNSAQAAETVHCGRVSSPGIAGNGLVPENQTRFRLDGNMEGAVVACGVVLLHYGPPSDLSCVRSILHAEKNNVK